MKKFLGILKKLFTTKKVIVWAAVSVFLVAFICVANVLTSNTFFDIICNALGGEKANVDPNVKFQYFTPDVESKEAALENGNQVTQRICEEGMVLLKNENNALPLAEGAKVSIFGRNSVDLVYGGSGSAAPTQTVPCKTVYDSLEAAGFSCNNALKTFYEKQTKRSANPKMEHGDSIPLLKTGETPIANYTADVTGSYSQYKDAALVVFSRIAGENWDLPRVAADNDPGENRHYLELDKNERALLEHVCSQDFGHVIVLFNGSNNIDMAFLKLTSDPAYNAKIDGAILAGSPGATGIMALGRILKGQVNPSGHLTDTIYTHYQNDPTWQNFGDNGTKAEDSAYGDAYIVNGEIVPYFSVAYEEGIYLGYRYYETRYAEMEKVSAGSGEAWYNQNVLYPFGYGLSYTTFTQEIANKAELGTSLDASQKFTVKVNVTNTGSKAGKQVVQLYASAPYESGEIEKSAKVLVGFAKTDILQPGQTTATPLEIEVDPYSFASFDALDLNSNGNVGYELEDGNYTFYLGEHAHDNSDSVTLNLANDYFFENDPVTGTKVEPLFSDTKELELQTKFLQEELSRQDFEASFPKMPTEADRTVDSKFIKKEDRRTTDDPTDYTDAKKPTMGKKVTIHLSDMVGKDYDDPMWEDFLDQLKFNQMLDLFNKGSYATAKITSAGVPKTLSCDGPTGIVSFMGTPEVYGTCYYCSECLVAQTYNVELAKAQGNAVGNEALYGDQRSNGSNLPYTGWYSPGVNLHRSPFSGRNTEYYSEDPFISGKMAAEVIKSSQEKGVYTTIKHFALNEQETHRSDNGQNYWVREQAVRELYLKPFEIAIKEGRSKGLMSSFTRIGQRWCGGSYNLLTQVLRNEWGFKGLVICDFHTDAYMDSKQMIYAGGDLNLTGTKYWTTARSGEKEDVIMLRRAAHNILYAVANSNAMNQKILSYEMPDWQKLFMVGEAVVIAGIVIWGGLVIFFTLRKKKVVEGNNAEAQATEPLDNNATSEEKAE